MQKSGDTVDEIKAKENRHDKIKYLIGVLAIFVYLSVCLFVFFVFMQRGVNLNVTNRLQSDVAHQTETFESTLSAQFAALETTAYHLAGQQDLFSDDSCDALRALIAGGQFSRALVIRPDGVGHTSDETELTGLDQRAYFQHAMQGEHYISTPFESGYDGTSRIALSIPIKRDDGVVCGVLAGTYDVSTLNRLLFANMYEGGGNAYITNTAGNVLVTDDQGQDYIKEDTNLFEYAVWSGLTGGVTVKQIQGDFAAQRAGVVKIIDAQTGARYFVFAPCETVHWMMCYIVPTSKVMESYHFISQYEWWLLLAFAVGFVVLLVVVRRLNARDRRSLLERAQSDPLTGLLNKTETGTQITEFFKNSGAKGVHALLMLDIDRFKRINDSCGHKTGDETLQQAAKLLQSVFREDDIIGRVGGDEFMVLMKDINDMKILHDRLEMVCERFRIMRVRGNMLMEISCSIGVACFPVDGESFDELYRRADEALYRVKQAGRDGFAVYETEH